MKNTRFGWILFFVFGSLLCAASAHSNTAETQGIQYFNSKVFDNKLSKALAGKEPTVKITFPVAFTINEIPERIDKWLVAVEDHGGTVDIAPEQVERGLLDNIVASFLKGVYEKIKERRLYRPAKNYNATIYYENRTTNVTRVIFSNKDS